MNEVEITNLDLRYEKYRMKSSTADKILITSILNNGIRDPLRGVATNDAYILLDGFKRYRCAKHLNIGKVPFNSLSNDEALGIIELLRISNADSLTILEQANLIDELKTVHMMSTGEIARLLEKSKGWVSMRSGMINEMSDCVKDNILSGKFPTYSYMYTLKSFIRMNGISKEEVDEFVKAVAGKDLSIRNIEILAHGYFNGPQEFRQQIESGNISWGLKRLKEPLENAGNCTSLEKEMLKDLGITQKYMQRVIAKSSDSRLKSNSFNSQANIIAGGIVRQFKTFTKVMEDLYDRSGKA